MNTPSPPLKRFASLALTLALACVLNACAVTESARESRSEIAVEVIRDDWGVPHIFSDSEEGGYYGFGYAYAEDRLQRLIGMVLLARGELSSFLGPGQLQTDITARQWRALEMARASVDRLDPQLQRNYIAFIAGVQAYAARPETPAPLARAASTLELADIVAVPRALLYLGYQVPAALAECRLNGMTYSEAMLPYQSSAEGPASNGWVVAPQRTAARATIVASDPHVENENLAYYEYHIDAGRLHSSGYAIGAALWQAHNENVAWSFTTGAPDVLDCYAVQTDPDNPRRFLYDGRWLEMESRTETINVTGAEPITRTFEYTRHNGVLSPVVARVGEIAYVVSAADMDRVAELNNEFYRMNLARSVDGLRAALSTMSMFPQNISAGDRAGHTLYLRAGRAPRRPSGYDFTRPVPGNTSATAWRGVHALRDLVQMESPSSGYFQNNNVAPDVMIEGGAAGSLTRYAPDLFNDTSGRQTTRGARALQWLSSHPSMTLEDATALMEDETWITASGWIEALSYAIETRPQTFANLSAPAQAAAARLLHFDGVARADSEAAADFLLWRNAAANDLIALDDGAFVAWPWRREQLTPALADVLLQAMRASVEARTAAYGDRTVRLGDLFSVRRGGVQAPVGGVSIETPRIPLCLERVRSVCERTMRAFGAASDGANRFRIVRGSQAMRLVQFTTPLRAYSAYAFGQSDDPNSPHYADQITLFAGARMKPAYFSRAELEGHISARQQLRYTDQDQHAH